ncbi:AbrB/MazE/SpoVT family DNA-binding domain-containing protein [Chamaesiphon sp.]|uniref:AbrB/MazE/SpoVT family DNA-binding domain-containing protein n=1 Tax=Chamaesiphon sp. TaxID=2814140 RepID=UPI0035939545
MRPLKIKKIVNSLGVILFAEIIQKLQVNEGDSILAIETADGIHIIASDPEFESGMEAYRQVVSKYTHALKELAK